MASKAKTIFVPFKNFLPDKGLFLNPGLASGAKNFLALHGTSVPSPAVEAVVDSDNVVLPERVQALHVHLFGLTDWRAYYGEIGKLWEFDPTGPTTTDVSRTTGGAYTSKEWFFTSFGDSILATNFADDVQILLDSATEFEKNFDTGDAPKARYIAAFRSHIVLGNYVIGAKAVPHGILWTATDNPRLSGTPAANPADNTDRQPLLDDLGAVNGLAAGREYLLIFRDKGITRMDGPFNQPVFATLDLQASCRWPRSIVQYGDDTYFWGDGTIKVVRGGSFVEDVGSERVNQFLFDERFGSKIYEDPQGNLGPSGIADPSSNQVLWLWRDDEASPTAYGLAYNPKEDRWSYLEGTGVADTLWTCPALKPGTGEKWAPLHRVLFVYGNYMVDNLSLGRFSAATFTESVFPTGYLQEFPGQRTRVNWIRPIVRNASTVPTMTVRVVSKANPWDTATSSDVSVAHTTADGAGHIYLPPTHQPEEFIQYELMLQDASGVGSSEIEGLEVNIEEAGATFAKSPR